MQVGELITDPIQRHVKRRLVRQREKIHEGVEASGTPPTSILKTVPEALSPALRSTGPHGAPGQLTSPRQATLHVNSSQIMHEHLKARSFEFPSLDFPVGGYYLSKASCAVAMFEPSNPNLSTGSLLVRRPSAQGAAVSIVRIRAKRPRSTQEIQLPDRICGLYEAVSQGMVCFHGALVPLTFGPGCKTLQNSRVQLVSQGTISPRTTTPTGSSAS